MQSTQRHGSRPIDAAGSVSETTNGWRGASGPAGGLPAHEGFLSGDIRHFQAFHREVAGTVCLTGQNTSQAVTVVFTP